MLQTLALARGGDIGVCADTPNTEAAIAACTRLYEKAGLGAHDSAIVLGNRGAAFKLLGKYEEAIVDFTTAIELEPKNPQYRCQRGDVLLKKREFAQAITDFDAAIKVAPRLAWALAGRGHAYLAQGNADLATTDFTEALRTKPGNANYLYFRGRANAQRDQYDLAEHDFQEVLASPTLKQRLPKERASVLALHGFSLLKLKRAADAKPDVEEAMRLAPRNTFALTVMGAIERELGHKTEAKDYFQRALAIDPKAEVAQRALAKLEGTHDGAVATAPATEPAPAVSNPGGPGNTTLTPPASPPTDAAAPDAVAAAPARDDAKELPANVAKPPDEPADFKASTPTAQPTSEAANSSEPEKPKPEKLANRDDDDGTGPAEDLCARYFPTVGQTLLVACGR